MLPSWVQPSTVIAKKPVYPALEFICRTNSNDKTSVGKMGNKTRAGIFEFENWVFATYSLIDIHTPISLFKKTTVGDVYQNIQNFM